MTRTSLDDVQWASLMLTVQQIPRLEARRGSAAPFCRGRAVDRPTGALWRDLPDELGLWSSVYHRWWRWCVRGWWELVFEAMRPAVSADGCSTARPARRTAPQAARPAARPPPKRSAAAAAASAPSFTPAPTAQAGSCG